MKILNLIFIPTFLFLTLNYANAEGGTLTQEDAKFRAEWISDTEYHLDLQIDPAQAEFKGQLKVVFNKKAGRPERDLWLDHNEGQVNSISINGKKSEVVFENGKLKLKSDNLVDGKNEVEIVYLQKFSSHGEGLHKYKDPQDGEYYIYTQFEPYSANRMFPLFDQPDLKAKMNMRTTCPKHWEVVTAALPKNKKIIGNQQVWEFQPTAKISSYLFSIHAGPYHIWADKYGAIPLRLFARKSMVKMVDSSFWFKITKQGLRYYGNYFGVVYPFGKYDQLIVPEFNAGAMENVAAVTFSERYLKSGKPTRSEKQRIADVVLHEMAHMWFGNLVTMRWWNDLWLNESFATFMATMALANATEFKEAWEEFFGTKSWAMWEDQQPTTHPIDGEVKSTEDAWASFDGITYGKGASVMKQLQHYVGDKAFQAGLQKYFKKHSFGNTVRKDFTDAISTASGKSLDDWSKLWLEDAGLDRISAVVNCEGDKLKSVSFKLDNNISKTFRPHALTAAVLQKDRNAFKITKTIPVRISGAETILNITDTIGCPDLFFPNYGDYGYVKLQLDRNSVQTLSEKISDIPDTLLRLQSWHALWEMVREGSLSVKEYADIARSHVSREKNERVFELIASTLTGHGYASRNSIPFFWRGGAGRAEYQSDVEKFFYTRTVSSAPGSDQQKNAFDYYVSIASSTDSRTIMQSLLAGRNKVHGFVFDQDRRWRAVKKLCRLGVSNCEDLVKKELKNDSSDRAQNEALSARASQPIASIKAEMYKKITQLPAEISYNRQRSILNYLFPFEQESLSKEYNQRYFEFFRGDYKKYSENLRDEFAESLLPLYCSEIESKKLAAFVDKNKDLPTGVVKSMKIGLAEDARCRLAIMK